jgi:hypothetical protein
MNIKGPVCVKGKNVLAMKLANNQAKWVMLLSVTDHSLM